MSVDNKVTSINNHVLRVQQPTGEGPFPVLVLLHGWTGDENSMWVFATRLPKHTLLIAPRGFYKTKSAGYSWHPEVSKPWPWISDFIPAVESLTSILSSDYFPVGNFSELHIIGFSQGAALAYVIAAMHPERVATLAGLSGFLPEDASSWLNSNSLSNLPIFIAHGTVDDLVPIERARRSVAMLQDAGAIVTYCEDDVGHKLSAKCFRGLEAFYEKVNC
jgi:phospholipase/carboxylesterase